MSAFDPNKLEFWEVCKLVNYSKPVVYGDLRDPDCPQLKPILADDGRPLRYAGVILYDKFKAEDWGKQYLAWKGSEAERRKLAREQQQKRMEAAIARQEQESAARREQAAFFRANEETNRQLREENQALAFRQAGMDPEKYAAEQARLRARGL